MNFLHRNRKSSRFSSSTNQIRNRKISVLHRIFLLPLFLSQGIFAFTQSIIIIDKLIWKARAIRRYLLGSFVLLLLICNNSFSQSPYTSVATGNWNDDNTWSGVGTPNAGDIVTVATGHTVTITALSACANLTINGPAGILAIGNSTLTVSANLSGNGDGAEH